ncbi:DsbA family protein [Nocardia sp. CNY236]|uniref:mycothiol-dependent nitroreductase Rv2466c family protein n=1 Tax=Nocardia sp. CNY236 TaxID=1169152 RepID=UPI0003FC0817|nr:DsbA family protein [Nocardia sp. CNY236]
MTVPDSVEFHFDPMCPWAYQTSLWIREVRSVTGLRIEWRFFSLEEINRVEGKKHPWERPWSYGWSLMRIGALLRRGGQDALDRWYAAIGRELHELGGKPHDPDIARQLLERLGFSASVLDEAMADESTHADVRADHDRVTAAGGFGVPTLFFPDGSPLFGPVLIDPPTGDRAVRLWNWVTGMLEFPHLYEIQRPKSVADAERIGAALKPYLRGRDWVSVDRGKVIDMSAFEESAR